MGKQKVDIAVLHTLAIYILKVFVLATTCIRRYTSSKHGGHCGYNP